MTYLIKRTVIAGDRLDIGTRVDAGDIGSEAQIARLVALGAIEEVEDVSPGFSPPELDDDLRAALIKTINEMPGEDFDKGGKPKVKALEAALPDYADRITATVRDLIWAEMKAAANPDT